MAGLKEIRRRIRSVENTKKITRAMKLVSAAKLRKAQEAVYTAREYCDALSLLIRELSVEVFQQAVEHPLLMPKSEVKSVGYVVVGGSKGLCGAYNTNVHKIAAGLIRKQLEVTPPLQVDALLLGKKPVDYFRRNRLPFADSYVELPADPNHWPIEPICQKIENGYKTGRADEVYLVYTKFYSAVSVKVTVEKLLPLDVSLLGKVADAPLPNGVTLYEPSADAVFGEVVPRILRARVWLSCLEAVASEFGSRMSAMDSATNNATELLDKLRLRRNKLRQTGITSEILDIIGGSAVE